MIRMLATAVIAGLLVWGPTVEACTGIQLVSKDGGVVAARTLESTLTSNQMS